MLSFGLKKFPVCNPKRPLPFQSQLSLCLYTMVEDFLFLTPSPPTRTRFLAVEFLPPETDCPISDGGATLLEVDCSGGHRAWDFAYVPQDDTFIFAAIRKEGLLYTRQRFQRARTTHGFTRKCFIKSNSRYFILL
ncbi:hypothetical protein TSMEX_009742 [Taenia solium]|eukprot:TsM_000998100 transcript=TsM_000998100 gene=TsM_000998100